MCEVNALTWSTGHTSSSRKRSTQTCSSTENDQGERAKGLNRYEGTLVGHNERKGNSEHRSVYDVRKRNERSLKLKRLLLFVSLPFAEKVESTDSTISVAGKRCDRRQSSSSTAFRIFSHFNSK